jgi:hypothetical protein
MKRRASKNCPWCWQLLLAQHREALGSSNREMEGESASLAYSASYRYPSAMHQGNVLDDGKPQPRAAVFSTAGLIDPIEALEKS